MFTISVSGIEHLTCSWMGTSGTGSTPKDIPLRTGWLMTYLYVLTHSQKLRLHF